MGLFNIPSSSETAAENPVLLFRDLKRAPEVKFLWGHQEKVLDAYHAKHLETKDLAIELPAGTGKTLVGLLIGEFRRRNRQERVAFLCSTKQLADFPLPLLLEPLPALPRAAPRRCACLGYKVSAAASDSNSARMSRWLVFRNRTTLALSRSFLV